MSKDVMGKIWIQCPECQQDSMSHYLCSKHAKEVVEAAKERKR